MTGQTPKEHWQLCERCGDPLRPGREVMLEMTIREGVFSDPNFVCVWPEEDSQGLHPFGKRCAKIVLANDGIITLEDFLRRRGVKYQ